MNINKFNSGAEGLTSNGVVNNNTVNADPSPNDAVQGAKKIHEISKDAAKSGDFICVTWKNWVIKKLGKVLGSMACVPTIPFVLILDGISCAGSGVRLLFRKITGVESVVKKLPEMTEKHITEVENLVKANTELSNQVTNLKVEASQLKSDQARNGKELTKLKSINTELDSKLSKLENDKLNDEARAEKAEQQVLGLKEDYTELDRRYTELDRRKAITTKWAKKGYSEKRQLSNQLKKEKKKIDQLEVDQEKTAEKMALLANKMALHATTLHATKETSAVLKSKLQEQKTTGLKNKLADFESQKTELDSQVKQLEMNLTKVKEEKDHQEEQFQQATTDLQNDLKTSKNSSLEPNRSYHDILKHRFQVTI